MRWAAYRPSWSLTAPIARDRISERTAKGWVGDNAARIRGHRPVDDGEFAPRARRPGAGGNPAHHPCGAEANARESGHEGRGLRQAGCDHRRILRLQLSV